MGGTGERNGTKRAEGIREDSITQGLTRVIREMEPGSRLPSERLLAEQLGVSRTALRDRLQLLEAFGALRRVTGSGTYVQALDPEGLAFALEVGMRASGLDLPALHSVRVGLERQAAVEAAIKGDPVLIGHMRRQVMAMERAQAAEDLDRADVAFHEALFNASENPALIFFSRALAGALRQSLLERRRKMRRLIHDKSLMVRTHDGIHRGVESGSAALAAAAVDAHFSAFHEAVLDRDEWPADVASGAYRARDGRVDADR
ncbi:FadR/GntR family transcriptional regulator [Streptomyces mexicanus]|uniref:FadR family transcriptional regulator n=1 Tax=Streptomyces mexicanus TaxID=178566 RepID=A0A7X1I4V9_9ACTN|nr:FCD domain-containing protein [Streptomyces mexicanus]MBC2868849.1 FadR family transcriptional regulator [Streptomyces mexicanus]